jgi:hypothetical protein
VIDDEIRRDIRFSVRCGFFDEARLIEMYSEEIYAPGELDPVELRQFVNQELSSLREDQRAWPAETDCDRLSAVFKILNSRGIISIENAGNTQSDGYDDTMQIYREAKDKKSFIGYCFYHGQDLDRAVRGEGLYLAFGPVDPAKEESEGPRIGKIIAEELNKKGFTSEWKGTFNTRIRIPKVDWKRRIP